eukprot:TRINITY_DN97768_c0_g1_i1.p1 TRINITY_DN97768_c0_g1~~TRINITY_DN97768_c0_g1_i1.p1  ORF type:complete len:188 (-),score=26.25 TRINITY_DN97768_c0_g1_i1:43-606(-)
MPTDEEKLQWLLSQSSESLAEVPRSCCCLELRSAWVCSLAFAWFPWIFFQGAENVLDTCEEPELSTWLKTFSLVALLAPAVVLTLLAAVSLIGARFSGGTPFSAGYLSALHFFLLVAMAAYGWYLYIGSTSASCDGDGPFKPHTLLLVALLPVTALAGLAVCAGSYMLIAPRTIQDDYKPPPWGGYI